MLPLRLCSVCMLHHKPWWLPVQGRSELWELLCIYVCMCQQNYSQTCRHCFRAGSWSLRALRHESDCRPLRARAPLRQKFQKTANFLSRNFGAQSGPTL